MKQIITAILCLFLLTACTKPTPQPEQEDIDRSTVFSGELLQLPDDLVISHSPEIAQIGDSLSVELKRITGYNEYGAPLYETVYALLSPDGDTFAVSAHTEGKGGQTQSFALSDGGTVSVMLDKSTEVLSLTLTAADAAGEVLFSANPAADFGYDLSRDAGNMAGGGFQILNAVLLAGEDDTSEARYAVLTTEGLVCYRTDGSIAFLIRDANEPSAIIQADDRLLYLNRNREGQQNLRLVDTDAGRLTGTIELPEALSGGQSSNPPILLAGAGYDIYAYNGHGLWGVNLIDDAADGTLTTEAEQIIDWLASDIVFTDIETVFVLDAQTVLIAEMNADVLNAAGTLSLYRMVPSDEIPVREEIVIANLGGDLSSTVLRDFNLASEEYRVVVRDYTVYEDMEKRKLVFDTDIAAGNIPDIVLLSDNTSGTPDDFVASYVRSGLFCDLKPYMQADANFNYDGLLSYVTKPYETDGEQLLFPLYQSCMLLFTHADNAAGPMTAEETLDLVQSLDTPPLSPQLDFSSYVTAAAVGEHYDTKTAECSFDDPALAALIDRADAAEAEFAAESDSDADVSPAIIAHYREPGLFAYVSQMITSGITDPADAVCIGYPNRDRVLTMETTGGSYFAVTAVSEHKEICIDLLGAHLDYMRHTASDNIGTGTGGVWYHDDVDDQLARFEGKTVVISGRHPTVVDDAEAEEMSGLQYKITQQWAESYRAYLDAVERRIDAFQMPEILFSEEFRLNHDKSTEENLKIIQSRVSIYLSEQYK